MRKTIYICCLLSVSLTAAAANLSSSVGLVVYPSKGQSSEQQSQDDYQCYAWAKGQTGFDPINPGAPVVVDAENPGLDGSGAKGAVRGAATGALIGEVFDDDAGKGAKRGAAIGVVRGRAKARRQAKKDAEQNNQENKSAHANTEGKFKDAMGLCLESRGYAIR